MITYYEQLSQRKYLTYTTCQLPGCSKPLKRLDNPKIKKYCCVKHALEAQKLYSIEWKKRNKENVRDWNRRYAKKRWKRILRGEVPNPNLKKHAAKKT